MAAVTENVAFAVTQSTTYSNPYVLARQMSSLDHLTGGRCAWNVVTSHTESSAHAIGHPTIMPHDERYAKADEFMDVVYKYVSRSFPGRCHANCMAAQTVGVFMGSWLGCSGQEERPSFRRGQG